MQRPWGQNEHDGGRTSMEGTRGPGRPPVNKEAGAGGGSEPHGTLTLNMMRIHWKDLRQSDLSHLPLHRVLRARRSWTEGPG